MEDDVFNVILDSAAIGVIVTAVMTIGKSVTNLIQKRGDFRAQAADEYVNATRRASQYATALRAIADLLTAEEDGDLPSRELCARVQKLARHALGGHYDDRPYRNGKGVRDGPH